MSKVKRYDVGEYGSGMIEMEDGTWYHEDDYASVESDREALLESLENLVMFINADCCTDKATHAAELLIAKCRGIEE